MGTSKIWDSRIDYWLYKTQAKESRKQHWHLESGFKKLETSLKCKDNLRKYESYEKDLELIYDHIAERIRKKSKCSWSERGEKSAKFFLNLENGVIKTESENLL